MPALHMCCIAAALALAACSNTGDARVSPDAKPLGDAARRATITADALAFEGADDELAAVQPGQIVVSDWEGGYIRRVMNVNRSDGKLVLATEQATLTDVVEDGETRTTVDLAGVMARTRDNGSADAVGATFDVPLDDKEIYADPALGLSVRIAHAVIHLSPTLDLGIAVHDGTTTFHALAAGQISASLDVVATCQQSVTKTFTVTLWESPELTIPLPSIGPIPVSASGKLIVRAGIDVSALGKVTVTMGATATSDLAYGIRYENGAWQHDGSATGTFTPTGPTVDTDVQAHATVFLSAGLELGLYGGLKLLRLGAGGVVGMSVEPYVAFDFPSAQDPAAWALSAGYRGHYWAALTILDKTIAGIDEPGDLLFDTGEPIATNSMRTTGASCGDNLQNGAETGVDCGGASAGSSCAACAIGAGCIADGDCASGACASGTCVAPGPPGCSDHVWDPNAGEFNVDCGGPCRACPGFACAHDEDCASGRCDDTAGWCLAPASCYNGIVDPGEADVDCGGACQPFRLCDDGQKCFSLTDCSGLSCPGENRLDVPDGTCQTVPWNCFDCVQDGDEEGVDCGGSCATEPALVCMGNPPASVFVPYLCQGG